MHEGEWSAKLGIPGRPAEAESTIVARDLALAKLTGGRYHVLHMSTGASAELVRAAKAEGVRVTCEVSPQHLALTDEACASFDPVFKMNPPLRVRGGRRRASRAGLADGTIDAIATDHAPHAPETKERTVRGGAAGDARGRDRARGRDHPAGRAGRDDARRGARRAVVAPGAHRRARRARPRPPGRRGQPGEPLRVRSRRAVGGRPGPAGEPVAQHTVRGLEAHRPGPPHRPARRTHRHRPRGRDDRDDATTADADPRSGRRGVRGRGDRRARRRRRSRPARSCSTPRSPATRRSSPTRATRARSSRSPTRTSATTARTRTTTRAAARSVAASSCATSPAARAAGARPRRSRTSSTRHGVPGIAGIDTRRLTRHLRDAGAVPGAFGTDEAAVRAAAAGRAAPTASTSPPTVTTDASRTPSAIPTRRSTSSPTTSASSARSCATSPATGCYVEVVPAATPAAETCSHRKPDGIFLSNGPGDPAAVGTPTIERCGGWSARGPAVRHLPRPPDPRPRARRRDGEAAVRSPRRATTRCATRPPAGSRSRARTTTTRSTPTRSAADVEITHVNLNDGVVRGAARCRASRSSRVQHHPEAGPGPHDAALPVRGVHHADGREPLTCRRRTDIESILIIGSGPIVIGQACEFDYSGTQACRVLRDEGYRVILVNSNPATIMTDPEFADATYVEPLDVDEPRAASSSASGPTRCCRRSAARPR